MHLSSEEMVAIRHVLQSGTLSSDPADGAALERALGRLGAHRGPFPFEGTFPQDARMARAKGGPGQNNDDRGRRCGC